MATTRTVRKTPTVPVLGAPAPPVVPVALFAAVMGWGGLGMAWQRAADVLGWPASVGAVLMAVTAGLFGLILTLYLAAALKDRAALSREFAHPVSGCYFPAIAIGLMLVAGAALPYGRQGAEACWLLGAGLHLAFGGALYRRWLRRPVDFNQLTPAWLMPVIGNFIAPITGGRLGYHELSWFFFAGGLGLWLVLAPALFQRLAFGKALPDAQFPMVFLMLSPPAAGTLGYAALGNTVIDPPARLLMFIALFLGIGLFALVPRFLRAPFSATWWAYSFPSAQLATVALLYHDAIRTPQTYFLAVLLLLAASALTLLVTLGTLRALAGRRALTL